MSIEQTSQLLQLILNSVLLLLGCALVLNRLGVRQADVEAQLQTAARQCSDLLAARNEDRGFVAAAPWESCLLRTRKQLRHLQSRHQLLHISLLAAHYALLFALTSCFGLALRTLVDFDGLISLALGLFVLGLGTLLLSIGLTLIDLHMPDRALTDEVVGLLSLDLSDITTRSAKTRTTRPAHPTSRKAFTKARSPWKAKVG